MRPYIRILFSPITCNTDNKSVIPKICRTRPLIFANSNEHFAAFADTNSRTIIPIPLLSK